MLAITVWLPFCFIENPLIWMCLPLAIFLDSVVCRKIKMLNWLSFSAIQQRLIWQISKGCCDTAIDPLKGLHVEPFVQIQQPGEVQIDQCQEKHKTENLSVECY